ncbi:MAG: hypothetical protein ACRDOL_06125 [Streptosporangiaceae bacterium]
MLTGVVVYVPWLAVTLFPLQWHFSGGFSLDYGELLGVLPGMHLPSVPGAAAGTGRSGRRDDGTGPGHSNQ